MTPFLSVAIAAQFTIAPRSTYVRLTRKYRCQPLAAMPRNNVGLGTGQIPPWKSWVKETLQTKDWLEVWYEWWTRQTAADGAPP